MSSGYPRRKDSLRDDNEPAVADSGSEVHYRRMEPSSGLSLCHTGLCVCGHILDARHSVSDGYFTGRVRANE